MQRLLYSSGSKQHEERTSSVQSEASTVLRLSCPSFSRETKQHEERTSSDASTVRMLSRKASSATADAVFSRTASCVTEHRETRVSSETDVAHVLLVLRMYSLQLHPHSWSSASSVHDDHAHQHPATHHHDPASLCTTSVSADDFVRTPWTSGVRRMFDLIDASCDPSSPQGAWSNLEENVVACNILRTGAVEDELAGCRME
jgi:hypothetical protein